MTEEKKKRKYVRKASAEGASRVEASIKKLVDQLASARTKVATLESKIAKLASVLNGAVGTAKASVAPRMVLPPMVPPELADPGEPAVEPVELAPADNLGPGRWV